MNIYSGQLEIHNAITSEETVICLEIACKKEETEKNEYIFINETEFILFFKKSCSTEAAQGSAYNFPHNKERVCANL